MAERRSPARIDRELSQSLLAVVVLAGLALLAWAVAGLTPAVNNAVRSVFDRDDIDYLSNYRGYVNLPRSRAGCGLPVGLSARMPPSTP